jgi:hypothetical protein
MADGLDSLTAMRSKSTTSRRAIPPPRHQPRRTPVDMPAAPSPAAVSEPPKAQPATPPASGTDLTKVSIYLDDTTDASLEAVRAAARATKPRVDATRSAVVRLALTRLAEQLTPAEIVAELQRSAATHSGPGRKRA